MGYDIVGRISARLRLNRLWKPELDAATSSLRKDVRRLAKRIEHLEDLLRTTEDHVHGARELARRADRSSTQVRLVSVLNRRQRQTIEQLPALLDEERIGEHVRRAVAAAALLGDPYEHIIVEGVLPEAVYDLLISAIPPVEFFDDRDPIKQNIRFPMDFGPTLSATAWEFMDEVIAHRVIRPAVLEKFQEPLRRHFTSLFGPAFTERANVLPQSVSGGRLMLRRPGYHLGPHRDPKHSMLTCLLYLARGGDSDTYGTQIFRVFDDDDAGYKQTYYPEEDGRKCELVKIVPFKPNTMLVSLNSRGAHGATIPPDAPADLERYTYQFYVAPGHAALAALVKSLPAAQRAMWRSKPQVTA
jgi:hypothetical protein